MTSSWKIVNSKTFDRKFAEYARQWTHYSNPSFLPEDQADFIEKFRALKQFNKVSDELRTSNTDPTKILKFYAKDLNDNLYYTLKIKGWIGYYYLNLTKPMGVALFIAHQSDLTKDVLGVLVEALGDFNADK